jgi:hypothetical protein
VPYDDFSSNKPVSPMQMWIWEAEISIGFGRPRQTVQVTANSSSDARELICRMYNLTDHDIIFINQGRQVNSSGGSSGGGGVNIVGAFFGIIALCVVGSCQAIFDGNDSKSPTAPTVQQSVEQVDTREVSHYEEEEYDEEEYDEEEYDEEEYDDEIPAHLSVASYFQE